MQVIYNKKKSGFMFNKRMSGTFWRGLSITLVSIVFLSSCASYHPQPLPKQVALAKNLNVLSVKANKLMGKQLKQHKINLADGLDLTEVAILAVLGNPALRSKRAQIKVAGAQAFAAGLLPDPQLSATYDKPDDKSNGAVDAMGLGLSFNLTSLITRQARIDAKYNAQTEINLQLLWQEWQVIQQARSLAVRFQLEEQRLTLLKNMNVLYKHRYQRSKKGLAQGNITLDVNGVDLTAVLDSLSQTSQLAQTHNQTRSQLNLLLGLQPDAIISLAKLTVSTGLDRQLIETQLQKLADIRPDLLALKAGYQSQEANVRAAILAQFPSFSIGISRSRDTAGQYTSGFNIGLNLPFFDGNRGNIAIERATREKLSEEYQTRIAQTHINISRLLNLQTILEQLRNNLNIYLPRLQVLVKRARKAYRRGDIGALTFLNMESTWVSKRLELISMQQTLWENRIALQTLLAIPDNNLPFVSNSLIKNKI